MNCNNYFKVILSYRVATAPNPQKTAEFAMSATSNSLARALLHEEWCSVKHPLPSGPEQKRLGLRPEAAAFSKSQSIWQTPFFLDTSSTAVCRFSKRS